MNIAESLTLCLFDCILDMCKAAFSLFLAHLLKILGKKEEEE